LKSTEFLAHPGNLAGGYTLNGYFSQGKFKGPFGTESSFETLRVKLGSSRLRNGKIYFTTTGPRYFGFITVSH